MKGATTVTETLKTTIVGLADVRSEYFFQVTKRINWLVNWFVIRFVHRYTHF